MAEVYDGFIVFDLENTGDRRKLKINQKELQDHLNPEQVLIIVREDLRRIYIWKGSKSPVRKRFISSKVAQELQKELINDPRYHRCKIVSIDQGDELQEFLNAFRLESMEVKERLPDMHYIRNIEREKIKEAERLAKETPEFTDMSDDVVISSFTMGTPGGKLKSSKMINPSLVKRAIGLSEQEKERIKEKILKLEIPEQYERQNLILGHTLYGAVSKVTDVFGKNVVDIVWEEVKKVPKGVMVLDDNKFRVYFDDKKGMVEAVEVLKEKQTPKQNLNQTTEHKEE
ncbi:MAG: hypothetical protein ACXACC_00500 [Promethearchaeota archaeon]|jgi:hypothetical protein